jgi:hypothetical protein
VYVHKQPASDSVGVLLCASTSHASHDLIESWLALWLSPLRSYIISVRSPVFFRLRPNTQPYILFYLHEQAVLRESSLYIDELLLYVSVGWTTTYMLALKSIISYKQTNLISSPVAPSASSSIDILPTNKPTQASLHLHPISSPSQLTIHGFQGWSPPHPIPHIPSNLMVHLPHTPPRLHLHLPVLLL